MIARHFAPDSGFLPEDGIEPHVALSPDNPCAPEAGAPQGDLRQGVSPAVHAVLDRAEALRARTPDPAAAGVRGKLVEAAACAILTIEAFDAMEHLGEAAHPRRTVG